MRTAINHPVPDRVKPSFVIFDIRALWRSGLIVRVPGCQKLQMTGLTRSGTGWFIAMPIWQQRASKGTDYFLHSGQRVGWGRAGEAALVRRSSRRLWRHRSHDHAPAVVDLLDHGCRWNHVWRRLVV